MAFHGHARSLILVTMESAYGLLLVVNSKHGGILPRFRDNCRFSAKNSTPAVSHPNFGCVPLGLDCPRYINVTDRRTTYDSNTALAVRASRGENVEERMGTLL